MTDLGNLPRSLRGLAASSDRHTFNEAGMAVLVAATGMLTDAQQASAREKETAQEELKKLQEAHGRLRERYAKAKSELRSECGNGTLRLVMTTVGAVLLGLIPYGQDKAHFAGALACGIFGGILVVVPWLHTWFFGPTSIKDSDLQ